MDRAALLFARQGDDSAKKECRVLGDWLRQRNIEVIDVTEQEEAIEPQAVRHVELGVAFGGDGTFLTLVRRLEKKDRFPLIGVNMGSLGFITQTGEDEVVETVQSVLDGNYSEEIRPLVQVELFRQDKQIFSTEVFNDAVINKDVHTSMLRIDILIDGDLLSHTRSDGYVIATPTGSTGYGMSTGGPLLHPEAKAMVLRPICSHSLSVRSVVIPQKMVVDVAIKQFSGPAYLVCDGKVLLKMEEGDRMRTKLSDTSLRMIKSSKQTWTDILRAKLHMS